MKRNTYIDDVNINLESFCRAGNSNAEKTFNGFGNCHSKCQKLP